MKATRDKTVRSLYHLTTENYKLNKITTVLLSAINMAMQFFLYCLSANMIFRSQYNTTTIKQYIWLVTTQITSKAQIQSIPNKSKPLLPIFRQMNMTLHCQLFWITIPISSALLRGQRNKITKFHAQKFIITDQPIFMKLS